VKKNILLLTALLITVNLQAADFGLIFFQNIKGGMEPESLFNYSASLFPYVSVVFNDKTDLYISGGVSIGYDREFFFLHEILRTEFSFYFNDLTLTAGRMQYTAPFEYVADGLFDGFLLSYSSLAGNFRAGAWYTGLLYKRRAVITMTVEEYQSYYDAVDYTNFTKTYFSPRRVVTALDWEYPAVAGFIRTKLGLVAQFDVNGGFYPLHSQYITADMEIPYKSFLFELGGALQFTEAGNNKFICGGAWELGAAYTLPTSVRRQFSLNAYFSGGKENEDTDVMGGFIPVTTRFFGNILQLAYSGFSAISLDYIVRPLKTISVSASASIILKSFAGIYSDPQAVLRDNQAFLGTEIYSSFIWGPVSDFQLGVSAGLGLFTPTSDKVLWHVKCTVTRSLY